MAVLDVEDLPALLARDGLTATERWRPLRLCLMSTTHPARTARTFNAADPTGVRKKYLAA